MTIYGWDASHYDAVPAGGGARVATEGFSFFTHKAGGDANDAEIGAWWSAVRSFRDRLLLGAYWVLYPGTPATRAEEFLARLDSQCPGWPDGPFILQADCEKWNGDSSTKPGKADIKAFCDRLRLRAPKLMPIVYASAGQYGNELTGLGYPLWNARYPLGSAAGTASGLYARCGGDSGPGWAAYSGQTPAIWQYSSSATVAGQTTSDVNAFRGTLADLVALVAPGWETDVTPDDIKALVAGILTADINPDAASRTSLGGALWMMLGRTDALNSIPDAIDALPTAGENAQAVLAALGTKGPQEIADALRAVLGDQAAAVGALLAAS